MKTVQTLFPLFFPVDGRVAVEKTARFVKLRFRNGVAKPTFFLYAGF